MASTVQEAPLLIDATTAAEAVAEATWSSDDRPDRLGLEIEAFPMIRTDECPPDRLPLHGSRSVLRMIADYARSFHEIDRSSDEPPSYKTLSGGRLTFEPGGQVEYSSPAFSGVEALATDVERSWDGLSESFTQNGVALVPLGVDPWHGVHDVPQQQSADRYQAMDRYFTPTWPEGAVMMRNTCSIQVNVESGTGTVREERWLAANLISPILTAMFTSSPDGAQGVVCRRARVWQSIDPTRTGLPIWSSVEQADALADSESRALRSSVMFVTRDGRTMAMEPGWSFAQWVSEGHPEFGHPSVDDLRTHLSTLFPEVRPRNGTLELRGIDALPRRWWTVPCVVAACLLYDDQARGHAIELLSQRAGTLPLMWRRAAGSGLQDAELGRTAEKLAQLTVEAAGRLPLVDEGSLRLTEDFLDRFTMRGTSPADELRPLLEDPPRAVGWASTPDGSQFV